MELPRLTDAAGCHWTLEAVVDQFSDRLLRAAVLILDDRTLAEDMVQETFIAAVRHWNSFRGDSQIYTWLYRILLRLCRRRQRRRSWNMLVFKPKEWFAASADEKIGPEECLLAQEKQASVRQAVQALSPADREVVALFYGESMTVSEIAEVLQQPAGTVKSRLHRSRARIRKILETEGFVDER